MVLSYSLVSFLKWHNLIDYLACLLAGWLAYGLIFTPPLTCPFFLQIFTKRVSVWYYFEAGTKFTCILISILRYFSKRVNKRLSKHFWGPCHRAAHSFRYFHHTRFHAVSSAYTNYKLIITSYYCAVTAFSSQKEQNKCAIFIPLAPGERGASWRVVLCPSCTLRMKEGDRMCWYDTFYAVFSSAKHFCSPPLILSFPTGFRGLSVD